jgi:hypothetical protein
MRECPDHPSFMLGVHVGSLTSGSALVLTWTVLVPTTEFRVKILLLLQHPKDYTLHLAAFGAFLMLGFLALALMRLVGRRTLAGVATASMVAVGLGGSAWIARLPEVTTALDRAMTATITVVLTVAALALVRGRAMAAR